MIYGYLRASTDKQSESAETQKYLIQTFMTARGLTVDAFFVDPATSGKKFIWNRKAGGELMNRVMPGDSIVVWRLDRMSRSFLNSAKILEFLGEKKVGLYSSDIPGGQLIPDDPISEMVVGMLLLVASYERKMIVVRTKEGLAARKARNQRHTNLPPFGFKWEPRYDRRTGRTVYFRAVCPAEQQIIAKCVELRAKDMTYAEIRRYLRDRKYRNRKGLPFSEFHVREICLIGARQLELQEARTEPSQNALEEQLYEQEEVIEAE